METIALETLNLARTVDLPEGPKPLLRGLSFRLEPGKVLAVLGPSGAGKSTLLRLLNRLDEPTSGQVLLSGKDYREFDPRDLRRRIGMVMQRPYLFAGTAAENICYGPTQNGARLRDTDVLELAEQVGMRDYVGRDVAALSGGEAQRISIARALANRPDVLLLDEPTSALDETAKQGIEDLLSRLVRERRATCVWVTHEVAQVRRVADVVLKIESGTAVALGTPAEMLRA